VHSEPAARPAAAIRKAYPERLTVPIARFKRFASAVRGGVQVAEVPATAKGASEPPDVPRRAGRLAVQAFNIVAAPDGRVANEPDRNAEGKPAASRSAMSVAGSPVGTAAVQRFGKPHARS
jgi:hypothetical protein